VLQIYPRHYPPCRYKSRRYRRCPCPIWVQGSLAGEWIKKSLGVTSWEAATDLVRGWESAGGIGQQRREIPSVADAIAEFLVDAEARELKPTSIRKYRQFLEKQLLPFAEATGKTRLHHLDVEALRSFRSSWKFKASTQQKKLETLRGFFRFCASAGWIPSNPAPAVKLPKVHQLPTLPFTDDEFNKLLDACDRSRGKLLRPEARLLAERAAAQQNPQSPPGGQVAVPPVSSDDDLDLEVLQFVLLRRSEMHAVRLRRQIAAWSVNGHADATSGVPGDWIVFSPGDVRQKTRYQFDLLVQFAIEPILHRPQIANRLRDDPAFARLVYDALYYPVRVLIPALLG